MLISFLSRELPIPSSLHFYLGSFSYTSHAGFILIRGVSLTHPMLTVILCGEFLLHIPRCLHFYAGNFSYTSNAVSIFVQEVCVTHPVLPSFLCGEFLLHIPSCLHFLFVEFLLHITSCLHFYVGSFSYTSHGGFISIWGVSSSYTSHAGIIFIWGVSLTHPVLALILSGDFLLHMPCWLHFYQKSFSSCWFYIYAGNVSYISRAAFIFMQGVSLTDPKLPSFLCGELLFHIPCWLLFMRGVSLTHPELTSFLCGEFLLHVSFWLFSV